ncbi:MAG: hypothetical protein ACE5GO_01235 [Anaerolineales bacterium]
MQTKLSRYCEGIMEAAWLAALVVVPVFFNIYSSRIFEPDKLTLLRSLALVTLGAWIVKLIDQGGVQWEVTREPDVPWYKTLLQIPLIPQTALLAAVFLMATIFSVTPQISFWGSYQRLQGTYTTLSYMVIFAAVVGNLRRRPQVERLILTVILASLPVGLYGILQRYQIDPVPWGGNVSRRIAANMGNSIFVAAYLIMAFPLTIGKIVNSFSAILKEETRIPAHVARGTVYVFTAAIQLIAIYLSGSRGPMLGLLAGSFFLFLLLSLYWGKRWLTVGTIGAAAAVGAFLIVFSIPNGPLAHLRSRSGFGRLGNVFDIDSGTGLVRVLIWDGASKLVFPHKPLEYPDGDQDSLNFLRPLIGYGPESMYVAYNSFYPPELANVEARNASPDRSHNETWDSLVITGFVGLAVYLTLFMAIFYYGLKWLRMINTPTQRNLFLGLVFGGGVLSAAGFVYWQGIGFFGVGLPSGMVVGLITYLALISIFARYTPPQTDGGRMRALTLMMFLAAIIAHFVEIHFGIAIAATRTHFWVYAGVLIVVGHIMTRRGIYGALAEDGASEEAGSAKAKSPQKTNRPARKKRRGSSRGTRLSGRATIPAWRRFAVIGGVITAFVMLTLGFDFITNSSQSISTINIIWTSLTTLPNKDFQASYGVFALFVTLWVAAGVLFTAENKDVDRKSWLPAFRTTLGLSGGISFLFWLIHASSLARLVITASRVQGLEGIMTQASRLEGFLTNYYVFLLIVILLLARFLPREWPSRGLGNENISLIAVPMMLVVVLLLARYTNLRIIHADIAFKMADPFGRGNQSEQWQVAIELYKRANNYAPSEDHYYLFLGRGYLELSRLLQAEDPGKTQRLMEQAKVDLELAQTINPLNTDHTANLARLHRFWSSLVPDQARRKQLAQESSEYYSRAVVLSPQNVVIWNEWAVLYMSHLNDPARAVEILEHSLEVDPLYHGTYGILGDYYASTTRIAKDGDTKRDAYNKAVLNYQDAITRTGGNREAGIKYKYLFALGNLHTEMQNYRNAIEVFEEALSFAKNKQIWQAEDRLARLYAQIGDRNIALAYASSALTHAPEKQQQNLQELINYLQQTP